MKQTSITGTPVISDDDAPKLTQASFDRASFHVAGSPTTREAWQAAVKKHTGKKRVNIMLDVPIIEHFKALAGERGYQTLINAALRDVVRGQQIEDLLRRIIREEMRST